jgi:hypothetical protein
MRTACIECVSKHLGQAAVLASEAHAGYPLHRFYVVGHMAEAEAEALAQWPDLAKTIRAARLEYMKGQEVEFETLFQEVEDVITEENH